MNLNRIVTTGLTMCCVLHDQSTITAEAYGRIGGMGTDGTTNPCTLTSLHFSRAIPNRATLAWPRAGVLRCALAGATGSSQQGVRVRNVK